MQAGDRRSGACSSGRGSGARAAAATVFFLDEIHRFNKAQQDALLPAVEEGLVTLIGATTENPYFEVNAALLSRARRVRAAGAHRRRRRDAAAARDRARRVGAATVDDEAIAFLAERADGDARTALAALELAAETRAARRVVTPGARRGRAAAARMLPTTRPATATTT